MRVAGDDKWRQQDTLCLVNFRLGNHNISRSVEVTESRRWQWMAQRSKICQSNHKNTNLPIQKHIHKEWLKEIALLIMVLSLG